MAFFFRTAETPPAPVSNTDKDTLEQLNAVQAVMHFSPDGTITDANQNFLDIIGYSLSEIVGKSHRILVDPLFRNSPEWAQFWRQLAKGIPFSDSVPRRNKAGNVIWINTHYLPLKNADGDVTGIVEYASDITPAKVRAIDHAGQITAINASQAMIEFSTDGTILTANENFLAVTNYQLDEIVGKHHSIFMPEGEAGTPEYKAMWEDLAAGKFHSGEFPRVTSTGQTIWLVASYNPIIGLDGTPTKIIKYASDITQEKQRSADFTGQIDAIHNSQAVIEFNMDGAIVSANGIFLGLMEYSLSEIVGNKHAMFVDPAEATSPEYQAFWADLNAGNHQSGEFMRVTKSGKQVWIQGSYTPILGLDGKPCKVVKYASDITEEKQRAADFAGQIDAIDKSQAVIEFDLTGTILTANENFLHTMGYERDEVCGRKHAMFAEPDWAASPEYAQFWAELAAGQYHEGAFKRLGNGGKEVWIQASYNPILGPDGKPYKVVKYATDITQTKRAVALMREALENLAKGDLSYRIDQEIAAEFEPNRDAFNFATQKLSEMIESIQQSSTAIAKETATVASNAKQLSSETESQAASLEQTAAAMEEIALTIKGNQTNTENANETAAGVQSKVQTGQQVALQAVEAVGKIEESSKQIGQIISVIESIAFQTNLLALNAAVEAARAGDAGRGFTVVASEVRALAQRSASAAKDIADLIQASGKDVGDGVQLVRDVGDVFKGVSAEVGAVVHNIDEVANASAEQTTGVNEVSEAITNMDQITQKNANIADISAESARQLSEKAIQLSELTKFFSISTSEDALDDSWIEAAQHPAQTNAISA